MIKFSNYFKIQNMKTLLEDFKLSTAASKKKYHTAKSKVLQCAKHKCVNFLCYKVLQIPKILNLNII